jgi:hypothetical protein
MTNETFTAKGVDVTVWGLNEYVGLKDLDFDNNKCTATVKYTLEPDVKEWGIRGISVSIDNIECEIECYYPEADDMEPSEIKHLEEKFGATVMRNGNVEFVIKIDSRREQGAWTVDTDNLEFRTDGAFHIEDVDIDLKEKTFTLRNNNV